MAWKTAIAPTLALLTSLLGAAAARADGCSPVDAHRIEPSQAAGMKVWLFEDRGGPGPFRKPFQWAKAATSRPEPGGTYAPTGAMLPYGQAATVVRFVRQGTMHGLYEVRLSDGSTHLVDRQVVKFHPFWQCRPEKLLDPTRDRGMRRLDRRLVDAVWVRVRNPKAVGLESWGAPTAPGELGQLAFLLCNNFDTARPGDPASAYDTSCQGFAPGRDRSKSYRIRHEDLETVSPISMRIIFES
ncbi:hypothetical protein [Methylorubrum extorquens]|uniref:Uncharacterized protein n=1 Tax=Methylorubrum extorquens DSM 13060 TaxID=882800 RepID=H1KCP6_METEX|nr:hypothetical protein [Methylorubrum extorquens]EHP94719.1 hypothetical protein MetexDRAFT_0408 [Methylorubrum extorquens DSM 13060]